MYVVGFLSWFLFTLPASLFFLHLEHSRWLLSQGDFHLSRAPFTWFVGCIYSCFSSVVQAIFPYSLYFFFLKLRVFGSHNLASIPNSAYTKFACSTRRSKQGSSQSVFWFAGSPLLFSRFHQITGSGGWWQAKWYQSICYIFQFSSLTSRNDWNFFLLSWPRRPRTKQ